MREQYLNVFGQTQEEIEIGRLERENQQLKDQKQELFNALLNVNKIIAEGAEHGFNPQKNGWGDKLFTSQQKTSETLKKVDPKNWWK